MGNKNTTMSHMDCKIVMFDVKGTFSIEKKPKETKNNKQI